MVSLDSTNRIVKAITKDDKFILTWTAPLSMAMINTIAGSFPPQFNKMKEYNNPAKTTLIFSSDVNMTTNKPHPNFTRNISEKTNQGRFISFPVHSHIGMGIHDYGNRSLQLSVYAHTSSGAINAIIIDKLAPNPNRADFDKRMLRWLSRRTRFYNNTNDKPNFGLQDTYSNGKIALRFAPYKSNT